MRKLLLILGLIFCASRAYATNCALTSGANQATVQSALTAAASGSCTGTSASTAVSFAAGSYGPISSQATIPCGVTLITGPVVTYSNPNVNQTAILNGPSSGFGFGYGNCSTPLTIQYLQWNGEQSSNTSGNAGGFLTIQGATSNVTIQNSWIHGMSGCNNDASHGCGGTQSNGINIGGGGGGSTTSNVIIQLNEFGATSFADCAAAMNDQMTSVGGGNCNGVGVYGNTANVSVIYNNFHYLEQGAKYYEVSSYGNAYCNPFTLSYNTITEVNRIGFESQCNIGTSTYPTLMYVQYNAIGNRYSGADSLFDFSIANGCGNFHGNYCVNHMDYNVDIQNFKPSTGSAGLEFWGQDGSTGNYNLLEGWVAQACAGICWDTNGVFTFAYNTMNIYSGSYFQNGGNPYIATPTLTGNITSNTGSGTYTSVAPTISPAAGAQTFPLTVTFTNPGTNRDTNTGIWYTTDGSTPTPGSGTAKFISGGGTITLTGPATVKAVGMWGAINQPYSWPSGYGYVPSAAASAAYTSACTNCAATPNLSPSSGTTSSVTLSTTTPGAGIWYTTDGSTPTLPSGGVPTGTSSSYTPMCQPIAQPSLSALKNITSYGASTSASDNTAAIQSACTAAGTGSGTGIYIPAGTFNHTGELTLNCNVYGQGPTSELYCPSPTTGGTNCQMYSTGSNLTWSNFSHVINSTTRDSTNFNVHLVGGSNNRLDTILLNGGDAGGFFNDGTTGDILTNNGVFSTKADCNYETDGATNTVVDHTYVYNCGDDGISNVSYAGESGGPVNGSLDQWNNIQSEPSARGISVVGGENITIQDNLVQNTAVTSSIYLADETGDGGFSPVTNVVVAYDALSNTTADSDGNPYILLYAAAGSVSNALILGSIISGTSQSGIGTYSQGGNVTGVSLTNNGINTTGTAIVNATSGGSSTTNVQCSGNTQNGTAVAGGACGGTNPDTATGSSVTYSQCVVGTAKQYTGPIAISGATTIKAVAVVPGLTNSNIGSGTFTPGGAPALTSCSQTNTGAITTLTIGGTVQQSASCYYASVPTTTNCSTTDAYGNGVTSWGPPSSSIISVGQIGSAHPGLVTGLAIGTANSTATVTGGVSCSNWAWTVNNTTPTLTGATMVLQSGGTSVAVGGTQQVCANMAYVSPTENTQVCGSGTDAYGTAVSSYTSSVPADATINASTGVLTGVAAGSTSVSASTSPSTTVTPATISVVTPSTTPNSAIQGAAKIQGAAVIQ